MSDVKTTSEIFQEYRVFLKKENLLINYIAEATKKWLPVDVVRKEINRLFEKYRLPVKEPLMIEGIGDLVTIVNHPISAFHGELLEVLGEKEPVDVKIHKNEVKPNSSHD